MGNKSLEELIAEYFDIGTNECMAYMCTRDKSAFSIGTMSLDDFEEFNDDICSDIADYLRKNNVVVQNHGHWRLVDYSAGINSWECSNCRRWTGMPKEWLPEYYENCPHCGAKMDGELNNE